MQKKKNVEGCRKREGRGDCEGVKEKREERENDDDNNNKALNRLRRYRGRERKRQTEEFPFRRHPDVL